MSEKYNDDYKGIIKALFVMTLFGVIYSVFFSNYSENGEGVGPCFLLLYVMFGVIVVEWLVCKIKSLFSNKPEA